MLVNSTGQRCSGVKPDVHVQDRLVTNLCISPLWTGRVFFFCFVFQLMRFPKGENLALQILELICFSTAIQTFSLQLIARGKDPFTAERERFREKSCVFFSDSQCWA